MIFLERKKIENEKKLMGLRLNTVIATEFKDVRCKTEVRSELENFNLHAYLYVSQFLVC